MGDKWNAGARGLLMSTYRLQDKPPRCTGIHVLQVEVATTPRLRGGQGPNANTCECSTEVHAVTKCLARCDTHCGSARKATVAAWLQPILQSYSFSSTHASTKGGHSVFFVGAGIDLNNGVHETEAVQQSPPLGRVNALQFVLQSPKVGMALISQGGLVFEIW